MKYLKTLVFVGLAAMLMIAIGCTPEESQEQVQEQTQDSQVQTRAEQPVPAPVMGCEQHCKAMDTDQDGKVTLEEFLVIHTGPHAGDMFKSMDADGDAALTIEEFCAGKGMMPGMGRGMKPETLPEIPQEMPQK